MLASPMVRALAQFFVLMLPFLRITLPHASASESQKCFTSRLFQKRPCHLVLFARKISAGARVTLEGQREDPWFLSQRNCGLAVTLLKQTNLRALICTVAHGFLWLARYQA